jgi:hypothetical protein
VGCSADIDIRQTVIVDVGYRDTGTPSSTTGNACFLRNIYESEVAVIQVQLIRDLTTHKKNVLKSIAIEVSYPNASTVVNVFVGEDVHVFVFLHVIAECDAGFVGGKKAEEGVRFVNT